MNDFWFAMCLIPNAAAHPDQYVAKIPLEAMQLLYTAWHELEPSDKWRSNAPLTKNGASRGYRATNKNHPLSRWVKRSSGNYELCVDYALELCTEYTLRFTKTHDVERNLRWLKSNVPPRLRRRPRTPLMLYKPPEWVKPHLKTEQYKKPKSNTI